MPRLPQRHRAYISAMARFYPLKIEIDGTHYAGEWTLVQGYRVCVRALAYGSEIADIGRETPQAAAARTLEKIVRAKHKRQADWKAEQARLTRELAKLSRPRPARSRAKVRP